MYILSMDMGTSSTRVCLWSDRRIDDTRGDFGAKLGLTEGKDILYSRLSSLISELLERNGVSSSEVEAIIASGMATSEMGLCEIPHIALPADISKLAQSVVTRSINDITDIPFVFVPGLKDEYNGKLKDIMRGEETETFGIISDSGLSGEIILMLPGTHNKMIKISENGEIVGFCTTLAGELLDTVINNTVLMGAVSHDFNVNEYQVLRGAMSAERNGLTSTLFAARVMSKNGADKDSISSFVYGAVLSEDLPAIKGFSQGKPIYIGGRETLKKVYSILLDGESISLLGEDISRFATHNGLLQIYKLYKAFSSRTSVISAIEKERLISIVRAPSLDSFERAVDALYAGGVRLLEITFDRSGKIPKAETADMIRRLCERFDGKMFIGAGTVTTREDVYLAFNAGAKFIISPNCDKNIISLSRKLGLVSIPAALTPTEILAAIQSGADFIKLFPADSFGKGYLKAVTAPISDARILAVGGVSPDNAKSFIDEGFCGIGVGSNLYNKKLIDEGRFDEIEAIAKKYVEAVK